MLSQPQREVLHQVARTSIQRGTAGGRLTVAAADYEPPLQAERACFVTLHLDGALRGCVGGLEARSPLVEAVARAAYNAAFRDPRFAPVDAAELDGLELHISVLSPPEPLSVRDEAELFAVLRPGLDGLVIRDRGKSATFLPDVWDKLPEPISFVRQLRLKAGLAADHWSPSQTLERYTTEGF